MVLFAQCWRAGTAVKGGVLYFLAEPKNTAQNRYFLRNYWYDANTARQNVSTRKLFTRMLQAACGTVGVVTQQQTTQQYTTAGLHGPHTSFSWQNAIKI